MAVDTETNEETPNSDEELDYSGLDYSGLDHSSTPSANSDSAKDSKKDSKNGKKSNFNYKPQDNPSDIRSKIIAAAKKKNNMIFGGGALLLAIILVAMLLFLSSLIIPNLAENIMLFQFARVSRAFEQDNMEVMSEKAALDAENQTEKGFLATQYDKLNDKLFSRFDNLRPNKVLSNLEDSDRLSYGYSNVKGYKKLTSITIDGNEIDVEQPSFFNKVFHPIQTYKGQVKLASEVSGELENAMKEDGVGILIRGAVESRFIQNVLDVPLVGWVNGLFKSKNSDDAEVEETKALEQYDNPENVTSPSDVGVVQSGIDETEAQIEEDLNNPKTAKAIAEDGVDPNAAKIAANTANEITSPTSLSGVLEDVNTVYAIALPLCIIYDGSIQSSSAPATIQNNSDAAERSFVNLEAANGQIHDGKATSEEVNGLSTKLGNIANSNPERRASGASVDTAETSISPQTAGNDQYTQVNTFLPGNVVSVLHNVVTDVCSLSTNLVFAAGLTVANVASWFVSDGTTEAAEEAIQEGADTFLQKTVAKFAEKLGASEITGAKVGLLSEKLSDLIIPSKGTLALAGVTTGLQFLVRMEVADKSGELNDGLSNGNDLANQDEIGGNLNANMLMQSNFYGQPLSHQQLQYNQGQDKEHLTYNNKSMSLYERYLATSNPTSLLSRLAISTYDDLDGFKFSSIISSLKSLLNPARIIGAITRLFTFKASADSTSDITDNNTYYGIVQWGYTEQEENLMNTSPTDVTYQPLENDAILNQAYAKDSSLQSYIQNVYGPCYSDQMSQLLTSNPSAGPDTGNYYIVRDSNGDVISGPNGGLCSDYYLGPNSNDTSIPIDPNNGMRDYVFRWRLQQAYDNDINLLDGVSNAP